MQMTKIDTTKTYNVFDVAEFFIEKANQKIDTDFDFSEGITHLKLQKILYFAQATFITCLDRVLFNENIVAYQYGPVVEEVYNELKKYGKKQIDNDVGDTSLISEEDKSILQFVWEYFGRFSAFKLVDMTHSHTPRRDTESFQVINLEIIKEFYTGRITLS